MKFKSLKTRILVWFGSITILLFLIFSLLFYYTYEKNVFSTLEKNLYEKAIFIKENSQNLNNINLTLDYAIVKGNQIIKQSNGFDLDILNIKNGFSSIHNDDSLGALYNYNVDKNKRIIVYKKEIDDKLEDIVETMLVIEPLLLLSLIILASKLIDQILIPIKQLTKTSKEISINNFSRTIPVVNQENEIKELTNSYNEMIIRLQEGVNNLDRFNSDVSHELRTPLTVIRGEIDITLRKLREPEYYINSLKTISFESKQIEKIVENLLLLTKFTKNNIKKSFEEVYIDSLLLDTIYTYDSKIKEKNINLEILKIDSIKLNVNPILIKSIFSNLIDNSIKYSFENKTIRIELTKKDKAHFLISDEGIGISKENIPYLTNRFFRIEESRNKKVEGFGLGLAIVEKSIDLHNGKLEIKSEINKGTKVEVIL